MTKTDKDLSDVGTRYEHLRDITDEWADGIEAIKSKTYRSESDQTRIKELEIGIQLIAYRLSSLSNYHDTVYRLGSTIDRLHTQAIEKGGRGTSLARPYINAPSTIWEDAV